MFTETDQIRKVLNNQPSHKASNSFNPPSGKISKGYYTNNLKEEKFQSNVVFNTQGLKNVPSHQSSGMNSRISS